MALSQQGLQSVLASATDKVWLECLTIEHSDITTLQLVNNTEDLTRTAGTFTRFPFTVTAPNQTGDSPPVIDIKVDAVDQSVINVLRQLAGKRERPAITYEVVLADTPNTIEYGPIEFEFNGASSDGISTITIKASFLQGALNDAFPSGQFAPSNRGS